jgi:hypothetical protein
LVSDTDSPIAEGRRQFLSVHHLVQLSYREASAG